MRRYNWRITGGKLHEGMCMTLSELVRDATAIDASADLHGSALLRDVVGCDKSLPLL